MVWINTSCDNSTVPEGNFGGGRCICFKCKFKRGEIDIDTYNILSKLPDNSINIDKLKGVESLTHNKQHSIMEDVKITDYMEHVPTGMKAIVINKGIDEIWIQDISSTSITTIDKENMKNWRKIEYA